MAIDIGIFGNSLADMDKLYVCLACGKLSKDRFGEQKISMGWDESCMMHCEEIAADRLVLNEAGTRATKVLPRRNDTDGQLRFDKAEDGQG